MNVKRLSSSHILIVSFLLVIFIGSILLLLPAATNGERLSFIDSLFMSTSATCVTGLTVIDVGKRFTIFGQAVIMFLMQIGGLGIMTFSTIFFTIMGKSISLKEKKILQDSFVYQSRNREIFSVIKYVFALTLFIEFVGAVILFMKWRTTFTIGKAAYYAIFHSISAFCNAGFTLFPDSLVHYRSDITINIVFSILIILGGIGFISIMELWYFLLNRHSKGGRRRLSLHTKLVLTVTSALLFSGTIIFYVLENNNVLKGMGIFKAFIVSFFQSTTMRTAGFNSVDFGNVSNAILFITILFMIIGASPGSTGGGIKTTTFALLFSLIKARFSGREEVSIFKRSIKSEDISRSIAITFGALIVIITITIFLMISELKGIPHSHSRGAFLEMLFEVVSAYGTVGLSTGVTSKLTLIGKFLITITIFIGRLGPLTLAIAIRKKAKGAFKYCEEDVMAG